MATLLQQIERAGTPSAARGSWLRYHGVRLALALALAALTYALFPASPAIEFPVLEIGSVAPDNVIAPFAFDVRKTDEELRAERATAMTAVKPELAFNQAALDTARATLEVLLRGVEQAAVQQAASEGERIARVQQAAATAGVRLTPLEAAWLLQPLRREALESAARRVVDRWLAAGVATSTTVDPFPGLVAIRRQGLTREVLADSVPTFSTLVARARAIHPDPGSPVGDAVYLKVVGALFHPTLVIDRAAYERSRAAMLASVDEVAYRVRVGEKIVGAHEVVGREEHAKLVALREAVSSRAGRERVAGRVVGAVLFNALVIAILGLTLVLFRPQVYASLRALTLFAMVFAVVLGAAAVIASIKPLQPELLPIALAATLIGLLFDPRIAMITAMILAVLVGGQGVYRGSNALFINLIGGVAAAFSVRAVRQRGDVVRCVLVVAGAYLLAALAIGLGLDQSWREIGRMATLGALNAALSVALATVLLQPAEELTGILTYSRLLEWSDLNRPLMQRMSLEAPGTFDHTIRIANLVEAACNAVGANGLLGRVGAYYHDIGKLKKPQYFVENQPKGRNPHDKIKPQASAAIIKDHVRAGLDLADEYKLPKAIADFIPEHHGTARISYFLEKAKERDTTVIPNEAEFAYPGPLPRTAETAICMLADGVEAAGRVVADPTPEKIRDVVDHIVRQRIEQGQLREAPLTLKQIEIVKAEFVRVLSGMYHSRVDYPAKSGGVTAEFARVGNVSQRPTGEIVAVPGAVAPPAEDA
jgi:putative nucleotidyltransferase with HDIG domain